jgi:signal peptide peptidase SppA
MSDKVEVLTGLDNSEVCNNYSQFIGAYAMEPQHFAQCWEAATELLQSQDIAQLGEQDPDRLETSTSPDGIFALSLDGPLTKHAHKLNKHLGGTSMSAARQAIREADANDDVRGIMLRIDSPGGTVPGTGTLADTIADTQTPVFAFIDDLGASAAYWISSQADRVFTNRHAEVGSIGVFTRVVDQSEAFEREGLEAHVIKTAEHKGDFSPGTEVTSEQLEMHEQRLQEHHELFVESVARGRGLNVSDVEKLADGRVRIGDNAREQGLVDEVTTFESAVNQLRAHTSQTTPVRDGGGGAEETRGTSTGTASDNPSTVTDNLNVNINAPADGVTSTNPENANSFLFNENENGNVSVTNVITTDGTSITPDTPTNPQARVPQNPEQSSDPRDGEWERPSLSDYTDNDAETWSETSNDEKNRIARHYADAPDEDEFTDNFDDDLNLPHHFPDNHDNAPHPSRRGVINAKARLNQTEDLHSTRTDILSHLESHVPPENQDEGMAWQAWHQDEDEEALAKALILSGRHHLDMTGLVTAQSVAEECDLVEFLEEHTSILDEETQTSSLPLNTHHGKHEGEPSMQGTKELKAALGLDTDEAVEALEELAEDGVLEDYLQDARDLDVAEVEELDATGPEPEPEPTPNPESDADEPELDVEAIVEQKLEQKLEDQLGGIESKLDTVNDVVEERRQSQQREREELAEEMSVLYDVEAEDLLERFDSVEDLEFFKAQLERAGAPTVPVQERESSEAGVEVPNSFEAADEFHKERLARGELLKTSDGDWTGSPAANTNPGVT